jgi:hypothetical protein
MAIVSVEEDTKEGFITLFNLQEKRRPNKGETGVLTFKPGGPTGGYWDYEKFQIVNPG